MDKEQIIIDGVFINACLVSEKCKEFETCKIKNILRQLARKTQECEKLRIKLDYYIEKTKQLLDDLDNKDRFNSELQQECEELKEQLKIKDNENSNLNKKYRQEQDERRSYRKALEEIEGIAKNFGSYAAWQEQRINKILDIINKAKGEENAR